MTRMKPPVDWWVARVTLAAVCFSCVAELRAGVAKSGQGSLTVSPTTAYAGTTTNYSFRFRAPKNSFNPGSQATLLIPAAWSPPQTNDPAGEGYVAVTPVLSDSTASLDGITGAGPWTLAISFSTTRNRGGFILDYTGVRAPTNAGIYRFTAQTRQLGGVFRTLRTGSPSVTVNSLTKTNSTTVLVSGLNPAVYGDWVTFTATVTGAGLGSLSGTVTFRDGDVVFGTVPLDAQGQAVGRTNRFSVPDAPAWITAEYSGNAAFNGSLSDVLLQDVTAAAVTLSGLAALDRVYDGTTDASLDVSQASLAGVLAGDDVTLDASLATAAFADPNVGTEKPVAVGGLALSGLDAGNYLITNTPSITASISPALLTVTANDTNRVFGAANPPFAATSSGFVAGEDASVLSGSPVFTTPADPTSSVAGSPYPIVVSLGTLRATNYTFEFVSGWLTITPAPGLPQRIVSIVRLADGTVELTCTGAADQTFMLQATPDLGTGSWTTIATNVTDGTGSMTCTDPQAAVLPCRFYRTALP